MPFVKLDCGIVDSTIFCEPNDVFKAWITLLAKAGPDGIARITAPALGLLCRVTTERANEILAKFSAPETDSRTQSENGARIQRVDGGFLIVNYKKYRVNHERRRRQVREAVGRYRKRNKVQSSVMVGNNPVINANQENATGQIESSTYKNSCNHKAEAEAEVDIDKRERKKRATALPPDFGLTPERVAYASQHNVQDVQAVIEAFIAHHQAKGSTMKDWDAAWRTWVLREMKYGKKPYQENMSKNAQKSDTSILSLCKQAGISTHGKSRDELLLALQRVRP